MSATPAPFRLTLLRTRPAGTDDTASPACSTISCLRCELLKRGHDVENLRASRNLQVVPLQHVRGRFTAFRVMRHHDAMPSGLESHVDRQSDARPRIANLARCGAQSIWKDDRLSAGKRTSGPLTGSSYVNPSALTIWPLEVAEEFEQHDFLPIALSYEKDRDHCAKRSRGRPVLPATLCTRTPNPFVLCTCMSSLAN